jgi:uncharacterized YccA/Bax inhibitor family protein
MKTSNPVLQESTFRRTSYDAADRMTVQGVVLKTAVLLLVTLLTAGWMWIRFLKQGMTPQSTNIWIISSAIVGLVLAIATSIKKEWAPILAPFYACAEGIFLGALSVIFEQVFPGIVAQATLCTFSTLAAMLIAYETGLIKPTETLKRIIVAATGGIFLAYLASFILGLFGVNMNFMFGSGIFSLVVSVVVICVAALNFILDFDFIEQGAKAGAPKYLEWYGAFALLVTLVWLYIEFLRLISNLRGRD